MSKQTAIDLIAAITRRSLMIADNFALDLTREDLEYIFQSIGIFWLGEQVMPGAMVNISASRLELVCAEDTGETIEQKLCRAAEQAVEIQEKYRNE